MKVTVQHNQKTFVANLAQPLDISLPVANITRAWYIPPPIFTPVRLGENWVGSIAEGGDVNFFDITFNPHAHGTHTECLGHVTKAHESVNQALPASWFVAELISVRPQQKGDDAQITATEIAQKRKYGQIDALIIRTLPNVADKATQNLSNSNWPYLEAEAAKQICASGVQHLLIDQPSVDQEEDGGKMAAHKAFWNIPDAPRKNATITELIFISDAVADGLYLLNLQVAPIENDAAPSRPVLFRMDEERVG